MRKGQLVNAVNPRLALYSRPGLLAALILVLNYAIIVGIALLLTENCSVITDVETTAPMTEGPATMDGRHTRFIRDHFAQEHEVTSGGITRRVTVELCATENSHTVTAPWPLAAYLGASQSVGGLELPSSDLTAYSGTNIAFELPCWNLFYPCEQPGYTWPFDGDLDGWFQAQSRDNMPCRTPAKFAELKERFGDAYPEEEFKRQVWCSPEDRERAIDAFWSLKNRQSELAPGQTVDLSMVCGSEWFMAPGGVRTTELFENSSWHWDNQGFLGSVIPMYKIHWTATKTTETKTCPTFAQAFGISFGYASQIEIAITLVLIILFKRAGIIKELENVLDLSSGIVDTATARKVVIAADKSAADAPE
jgi:hypothetical protein